MDIRSLVELDPRINHLWSAYKNGERHVGETCIAIVERLESLVRGQFAAGVLFRVVPSRSVTGRAAPNRSAWDGPGRPRRPVT